MGKVKIALNSAGVRALLKSSELQGVCKEIASDIAGRAEGQWEVTTGAGKYRSYAKVSTGDKDTFYRNLHTNTLLKAMRGAKR